MKTLIKRLKGFFSKKPNVCYEDTIYHTGYYRFSEFHGSSGGTFTFGGVPSDKLDEYFNGSIEITLEDTYGPFVGFKIIVSTFADTILAMFAPARSSK